MSTVQYVSQEHAVAVYDGDADLAALVAAFAAEGLVHGGSVVLLMTPEHAADVRALLADQGIDLDSTRASGALQVLDAADTLADFLVDGSPRADLFAATLGAVLERAAAGDRPVHAFGEMVALLWAAGNPAGALALEQLWNGLARTHRFSLLCGYPAAEIERHERLADVDAVCRAHAHVRPPRSYATTGGSGTRPTRQDETSRAFVALPTAVRGARRWVREVLTGWDAVELVDDVVLATSELASNAVLHTGGAFRVTLRRTAGSVRAEFEDLSRTRPRPRRSTDSDVSGRGSAIIAALAADSGLRETATGKVIWAEFARAAVA